MPRILVVELPRMSDSGYLEAFLAVCLGIDGHRSGLDGPLKAKLVGWREGCGCLVEGLPKAEGGLQMPRILVVELPRIQDSEILKIISSI